VGTNDPYYFGNAELDQVKGTGWFIGQFVPSEVGLRHQTDVELKWGIHPDGEKRSQPWANGNGITISVLIQGAIKVTLYASETPQVVTLATAGEYIIFGPDILHSWEAVGPTIVLSVRFPSVEVSRTQAAASLPSTN
jgi:hypothetical protein